jgi:hypothetical protein
LLLQKKETKGTDLAGRIGSGFIGNSAKKRAIQKILKKVDKEKDVNVFIEWLL